MSFRFIIFTFITILATLVHAQDSDFTESTSRDMDAMLRAQLIVQRYRDHHLKKQSTWFPQQLAESKAKAEAAFIKGNELLAKGRYSEAIPLLESATQFDASNDNYFYVYAICLYKVKRYRRSLAFLNILETSSINRTELAYYEALNHLYLKEEDLSYAKFSEVREQKDQELSAIAAMYAGLLAQKKQDYQDARSNFEFILDFSKNPKLDQKAENALDNLNRIEQFQAIAKKKWGYSFFTSAIYDGNVLNAAKINQVTSVEAYRIQYGGILAYKAHFSEKRSFIPQFTASDIYSVDTKFKSDTALQATDPQQFELALPYRQNFSLRKKPAAWQITPAYSRLYMSIDEDGRDLIFESTSLAGSLSANHFDKWLSDYTVIASHDDSHLTPVSTNDDLSAMKYSLGISQTRLLDNIGRKSLGFSFFYSHNDADGRNSLYDKYTLSISHTRPLSEKTLGYARFDYNLMDFGDSVSGRDDKGFILTLGAFYNWTQRSSFNISAQYYDNDSSVAAYDYDKAVVSLMYVFRGGFF